MEIVQTMEIKECKLWEINKYVQIMCKIGELMYSNCFYKKSWKCGNRGNLFANCKKWETGKLCVQLMKFFVRNYAVM